MNAVEREPRWFWWPATQLTCRYWPLVMRGGDEWCRRTLGVRLPGGTHHELADYAAGCICPSYLDDCRTVDETDPWPDPACDYHRDWWLEQQAKAAAT